MERPAAASACGVPARSRACPIGAAQGRGAVTGAALCRSLHPLARQQTQVRVIPQGHRDLLSSGSGVRFPPGVPGKPSNQKCFSDPATKRLRDFGAEYGNGGARSFQVEHRRVSRRASLRLRMESAPVLLPPMQGVNHATHGPWCASRFASIRSPSHLCGEPTSCADEGAGSGVEQATGGNRCEWEVGTWVGRGTAIIDFSSS